MFLFPLAASLATSPNFSGKRPLFPPRRAAAFTLVEILIVVVILGILAAIAVPRLSNASQVARENTLREDMRFLRSQIIYYRCQHREVNPGYPDGDTTQTPTGATFVDQLTKFTDETGRVSSTSSTTYRFGPYLTKMPDNPVNSLTTIKILADADPLTPDDSTGWLYQPSTGKILPNRSGTDSDGRSFAEY